MPRWVKFVVFTMVARVVCVRTYTHYHPEKKTKKGKEENNEIRKEESSIKKEQVEIAVRMNKRKVMLSCCAIFCI